MTRQTAGNYTECWLTDSLDTDLNPDDLLPEEKLGPRDVVNIVLLFLRQREQEGYDSAYRVSGPFIPPSHSPSFPSASPLP